MWFFSINQKPSQLDGFIKIDTNIQSFTIPDGSVVVGGKVGASVVVGGKVGAIVDDTRSNKVSKVKTKQNMSFLEYLYIYKVIL